MRIGLISDTHLYQADQPLPSLLAEAFAGVQLILHAGDLCVLSALDQLEAIAPVRAARGYSDPPASADPRLADFQMVTLGKLTIGMVHDLTHPAYYVRADGPRAVLRFPPEPLAQTLSRRFGAAPRVVVFGDTHLATLQKREEVLLVNPGSPTHPDFNQEPQGVGSVAILEVTAEAVEARILLLTDGFPVWSHERLAMGYGR